MKILGRLWELLKIIHYDERGGTGTAVATDDIITAAKMNLKLEDYALIDNEVLSLGTGVDFSMKFDASKVLITLASQFSLVVTGGHFALETLEDDKRIRLNSRNYAATSGDIMGFDSRPRANASGTQTIIGGYIGPGANDGVALGNIIGILSDPYLKGSSGDLSGDIRALQGQVTDENVGGRTIDGVVSMFDAWQQLAAHTFTGGVYVMTVRAAGGATPWSGFAKLPDDSQVASDGEDKSGGTKGWIKVMIGSKVGYIQVESLA